MKKELGMLQASGITHIICVRQEEEARFVKPNFPQHFDYLYVAFVRAQLSSFEGLPFTYSAAHLNRVLLFRIRAGTERFRAAFTNGYSAPQGDQHFGRLIGKHHPTLSRGTRLDIVELHLYGCLGGVALVSLAAQWGCTVRIGMPRRGEGCCLATSC